MRVLILAIIFIIGISISFFMISESKSKKTLKIYNPIDVKSEMVDSILRNKGYGHRVGDFSFYNQNNEIITSAVLKNKVTVVEYFFTTCSTICPKMNQQMGRIQAAFKDNNNVGILSFTVDPEIDTVQQMQRQAKTLKAIAGKWHLLTGDKKALYQLARTSFFVLKPAEAENQGDAGSDFIHTNNFVLIDQEKRIRGYYDGTSAKEVNQLMEDVRLLLKE